MDSPHGGGSGLSSEFLMFRFMNKSAWFLAVQSDIEALKKRMAESFYYAEAEDLQRRPAPDRWNALECFEHLTLVNETYLKNIHIAFDRSRPSNETRFREGLLGGFLIRANKPKAEGKIPFPTRTLKAYIPQPNRRAQVVFQDFEQSLDQLHEALLRARSYDLHSPVTSLLPPLSIRLGSAFLVLTAHMQRHLLQAERALRG